MSKKYKKVDIDDIEDAFIDAIVEFCVRFKDGNLILSKTDLKTFLNRFIDRRFMVVNTANLEVDQLRFPEDFNDDFIYKNLIVSLGEKEERGGKIILFYATDRNNNKTKNINKFYGSELSTLKYGFCEVNIPRGHVQGNIERPINFWAIEIPENESKHIVLKSINEIEKHDFFSTLSHNINQLSDKSAMIFIHGYNMTFAEAARRTAQIAWDIPFNGISCFFSWPSSGKKLSYFKDIEQADASIPYLEEFIENIVHQTKIENLHLIAHSMGNRLLTMSINQLSNKENFAEKLSIIKQIVLAAPDIDQNDFKNRILPQFRRIGSRRTLYSSDKDKALQISEEIRGGLSRLGDAGDSLFVDQAIDTIDASNIKSKGNNHSYIFDTKELLSDLYYLLNKGFDPISRRLQARIKNRLTYWLFPK